MENGESGSFKNKIIVAAIGGIQAIAIGLVSTDVVDFDDDTVRLPVAMSMDTIDSSAATGLTPEACLVRIQANLAARGYTAEVADEESLTLEKDETAGGIWCREGEIVIAAAGVEDEPATMLRELREGIGEVLAEAGSAEGGGNESSEAAEDESGEAAE